MVFFNLGLVKSKDAGDDIFFLSFSFHLFEESNGVERETPRVTTTTTRVAQK